MPQHWEDSKEWLARAVAGDAAALQALLLRQHTRLQRYIAMRLPLHLQPCVDVDDIAQDVYITAFKKITTFDLSRADRFPAWLGGIARNKIRDASRAARVQRRGGGLTPVAPAWDSGGASPVQLLEMLAVHSHTPSRSAVRRELIALVEQALHRVPGKQRAVLRLRFLKQLTVAETAQRIGRTPGAVQMLTHRGLRSLCHLLGGCGCAGEQSA